MPKKKLPPRLMLRAESGRDGGGNSWVIVDSNRHHRTGCAEDQIEAAQCKLAEYITSKWAPPKTDDASEVSLADVLLVYLNEKPDDTANPRDTRNIIARLNDRWGDYKVTDVRGKLCRDYAKIRGTPSGARKDLEFLRAAVRYYKSEYKLN